MEIFDKNSRVKTAFGTSSIDVADSLLSFQDYYTKIVDLNAPATDDQRNLNFTLAPSVSSELIPNLTELECSWKVLKADGQPMSSSDQIGAIQGELQ